MSDKSSIEWTEATWNPTTGCTKISPGCLNCYIERTIPFRVKGRKFVNGKIPLELHEDRLDAPLHWKKPRMIFVNSLSDLFHDDVPDEFIAHVFAVMVDCQRHTFQVLTKRAERMQSLLSSNKFWEMVRRWLKGNLRKYWPEIQVQDSILEPPNVWLGVSIENKKHGWPRVYHLRNTPAAVRFFSVEPLLEDVTPLRLDGIDWVIVGGESGPSSRPCDVAWIRSIIAQCKDVGVPCFVKQLGSYPLRGCEPGSEPKGERWPISVCVFTKEGQPRLRDKKGGDPSEWPEDLRVREMPERTLKPSLTEG